MSDQFSLTETKEKIKSLFSAEQHELIVQAIEKGHANQLGAIVDIETSEQEVWLNRYMMLMSSPTMPIESKVQQEMLDVTRELNESGLDHVWDMKEMEDFWQARLDIEKAKKSLPPLPSFTDQVEFVAMLKTETAKLNEILAVKSKKEKIEVVGPTTPISVEPKKRGRPKKVVT